MKRILLLSSVLTILGAEVKAQSVIDTVSVGAAYVNQNYYQLSSGNKNAVVKNEWDIAFQSTGTMSYGISINSYSGVALYTYPHGNISTWNTTMDTAGLSTWPKMNNSETTWDLGAFNQNANSANQLDLGWGNYDMATHFITGDSLFVIRLTNGDVKKLWIKNLANGTYNFVYANLDGTSEHTVALNKSDYATKNFGYYSLVNNAAVNHEPVINTKWDLVFTQYTAALGGGYTVTGILSNAGVVVAKAYPVANPTTFVDYQNQTYHDEINTIGYNWKAFTNNTYVIEDSTVYFVQAKDSAIWKVVMLGFGGSTTGNFIFSKEKLKSAPVVTPPTSINNVNNIATLSVYPNPVAQGTNLNIVIDLMQANTNVNLSVYDVTGKEVFKTKVNNQSGLQAIAVPTAGLRAGMYVVALDVNGGRAIQKVSIQ
jgi:hypothetical protein